MSVGILKSKIVDVTRKTVELNDRVSLCVKCPLCCENRFKPGFDIASRTKREIEFLIVKDFVTPEEFEVGSIFTSPSGLFFRGVLNELNTYKTSIGYAAMVQCSPSGYEQGKILRPPTHIEINECSEFLVDFLNIHRPYTVLGLGTLTQRYLPGIVEQSTISPRLRFISHPAAILKSGATLSEDYEGWKNELQFIFDLHQRSLISNGS